MITGKNIKGNIYILVGSKDWGKKIDYDYERRYKKYLM